VTAMWVDLGLPFWRRLAYTDMRLAFLFAPPPCQPPSPERESQLFFRSAPHRCAGFFSSCKIKSSKKFVSPLPLEAIFCRESRAPLCGTQTWSEGKRIPFNCHPALPGIFGPLRFFCEVSGWRHFIDGGSWGVLPVADFKEKASKRNPGSPPTTCPPGPRNLFFLQSQGKPWRRWRKHFLFPPPPPHPVEDPYLQPWRGK